ncbi:uncharacterized protein LOC123920629 [Trifolium pratense]|uniref:uncharacterized protein LOC123920629 n=1 Tax=Trifolium pratense TaxID=57577 RepID=UPI001E691276|nr:uncharacterized protein LOC123920629 [Trifolium pratense]
MARCLGFATLMLTISILMLGIYAQSECGSDLNVINIQCRSFIGKDGPKIPPSEPCCAAMKDLDVSCYCKYVTPIIEEKISIEKALYVAETCHSQNILQTSYTIIPRPSPVPPKA